MGLGVELAAVLGLFVADAYHLVFFSKTPLLLLVGWISLRLRKQRWRDVGFARPDSWLRAIAIGTVAGIGMELLADYVTEPALARLTGHHPDLSDLRPLVGNPKLLLVALALNWTLAAFGEELVYRGYLMNRLAGLGGGTPQAWMVSLLAVSAVFGCAHEYQGLTGTLQEGLSGLLLGLLYLGNRRNLTVPIVAHGVSNTVAVLLIYFDRYAGV